MGSYCIIKSSWRLQKRKLKNKGSLIIDAGTLTWTWFQRWKLVITVTLVWHETGCLNFYSTDCLTSVDFSIPSNSNILNPSCLHQTAGVFPEIRRRQVISDSGGAAWEHSRRRVGTTPPHLQAARGAHLQAHDGWMTSAAKSLWLSESGIR